MGGDNKRKQEGGGGGRGSKRRYMNKPAPKGSKETIPLGSRGILVSCVNSKEQQAGREAVDLFTRAYEELGGTWKPAGGEAAAAPGAADAPPTDIAAALAAEVAEAKDTSRQPLYYHTVGIHSVVYVECKDGEGPGPAALVRHVCDAAERSRQNPTRWCNRFYPVEQTCYASLEKINDLAAKFMPQHFPADADEAFEFAVQYDARAAPPLDRMQVIDAFAQRVPAPHKVNLTAPRKTILVNIVKSTAGVSVVEGFRELLRFNIRSLAMSDEERAAAAAAPGGGQASALAGGQGSGGRKRQQGEGKAEAEAAAEAAPAEAVAAGEQPAQQEQQAAAEAAT